MSPLSLTDSPSRSRSLYLSRSFFSFSLGFSFAFQIYREYALKTAPYYFIYSHPIDDHYSSLYLSTKITCPIYHILFRSKIDRQIKTYVYIYMYAIFSFYFYVSCYFIYSFFLLSLSMLVRQQQ